MVNKKIDLSIIIPLRNEEASLEILCLELREVLSRMDLSYELIFIDDGSKDNTFGTLRALRNGFNNFKLVKFKQKYGQSIAISMGFKLSKGSIIITLDGDLQNDPKDIPGFLEKIMDNHDIVCGWRRSRKDNFLTKVLPSYFGNAFLSGITGIKLHDFGCTFKAYRNEPAKKISTKLFNGAHRFIPVIADKMGFSMCEIEIRHRQRVFGYSNYKVARIFKALFDLLALELAFISRRGIVIFLFTGVFVFLSGLLFSIRNHFIFSLLFISLGIIFFLTAFRALNINKIPQDPSGFIEEQY
ncbi:MAG: glycosyltransferase family 2 protein [Candidatus Omnitrophota bacterium]